MFTDCQLGVSQPLKKRLGPLGSVLDFGENIDVFIHANIIANGI